MPLFLFAAGIYLELCFHALIFGLGADGLVFACLSGGLFGAGLAWLDGCLPRVAGRVVSIVLLVAAVVFAGAQLIYFQVFGTLMQLSLIRMGGDVFQQYGDLIVSTMLKNRYGLLLLLLPLLAATLLTLAERRQSAPRVRGRMLTGALAAVLLLWLAAGCLSVGRTGAPLSVLRSGTVSTEYGYQRLGLTGGVLKDLAAPLLTAEQGDYAAGLELSGDGAYDPAQYNVLSIDFDALAAETDDAALQALDAYFASVTPTKKNEYTGLLSGYNLITICAESFSPYLISETLTPTLYKLSQNGILFENFYGSFQSLTSNGEYALCTGLYPNMHGTSAATSFEDSISCYLPFTLGNSLGGMGYTCYAYHNNVGEFYSRNLTHPNMGYTFKAAGSGLDIQLTNPASDLELFEQSVPDLVAAETPFHAHYMTWSAHTPYNWTNVMSEKNRAAVAELSCSEGVKAYLASNLELEYGLAHLMETLEQAGLADNTVIVLTTDHFPYGLSQAEYDELAGFAVDTTFEKYRNAFLCYVPGLEENIHVPAYCSTVDILPTLLNLFGVEYDSRLLAGRDVLSDAPHIAVLSDQSFLTDTFRYDAASGLAPDDTVRDSAGYTEADYQRYVSNLFAFSRDILDSDYYAHVFSREHGDGGAVLVSYSDIENVFHKAAVQYVITHGLMEADSDELFGGSREAAVGELLIGLSRIAEEPADSGESAVAWARGAGLLTEADTLTADSPLDHLTCAVLLRRFAERCGASTAVDAQALREAQESYPSLSEEELTAALWATTETVINKSPELVCTSQGETLTRFQLASYLSYLCTHSLGIQE